MGIWLSRIQSKIKAFYLKKKNFKYHHIILPHSRIALGRGNIKLNKIDMVPTFTTSHTMEKAENF